MMLVNKYNVNEMLRNTEKFMYNGRGNTYSAMY